MSVKTVITRNPCPESSATMKIFRIRIVPRFAEAPTPAEYVIVVAAGVRSEQPAEANVQITKMATRIISRIFNGR
ncbi:hypothetical protein TW420 [Tropheryma whipplei TW08/27]|nr:hypothetical protein TW420 [Tropheryma whipplei TW08/27]